jgi:hypothetical protein
MCKRCEEGGEGCNGVFSKNWLMKMTSNNSVNVDFAKSWKHKLTFEHTKHKQYSTLTIGIKTNFGWNISTLYMKVLVLSMYKF